MTTETKEQPLFTNEQHEMTFTLSDLMAAYHAGTIKGLEMNADNIGDMPFTKWFKEYTK